MLKWFVNKQHFRCWTPKIAREIHESEKIVVLCAVGTVGVIEPYFVLNDDREAVTVNAERYTQLMTDYLIAELQQRQIQIQIQQIHLVYS